MSRRMAEGVDLVARPEGGIARETVSFKSVCFKMKPHEPGDIEVVLDDDDLRFRFSNHTVDLQKWVPAG